MVDVVARSRQMAWGPTILANMYHEFHEIMYKRERRWACGAILAQLWAWEHMAIVQP